MKVAYSKLTRFNMLGLINEAPDQAVGVVEHKGSDWYKVLTDDADAIHEYNVYKGNVAPPTYHIDITSIVGAVQVDSELSQVICYELTDLTISGSLAIPDRMFSLPLRRDDGRVFLFPAQVTDGEFVVNINIPTTGQFVYTEDEANLDLPEKVFTVNTLKIDCLRKSA